MAITASSGNPHSSWDFAVPLDPDDLPSSLQYASNDTGFDFMDQPASRQPKPSQAARNAKTNQLSSPAYASATTYSSRPTSRSRSGSVQSNHLNDTMTSTTSSASSKLQEYHRMDNLTSGGHRLTTADDEYSDGDDQEIWARNAVQPDGIDDEEDQQENVPPSLQTVPYERPGNTAGSVPGVTLSAQGKHPRSRSRGLSNNGDKPHTGKGITRDQQYWINRDKLARIENFELQQAGIRVPCQIISPSMPPRFQGPRGRDSRFTSAQSQTLNQPRSASRSRSYTRNGSRSRTSSKHRYRNDDHDPASAPTIPPQPELQPASSPQGDFYSTRRTVEPGTTDKDSGLGEDAAPPPPPSLPHYDRANGTSTPTRKATSKIPIPSSIGGAAAGISRLPVPMSSYADSGANVVLSDRPSTRDRANTTCSSVTSESGRGTGQNRGRNGASSPVSDEGRPRSNSSGNLLQQATAQLDSSAKNKTTGAGVAKQANTQASTDKRTRRTSQPTSSRKNTGPSNGVQKAARNTNSGNSSTPNTPTSFKAAKTGSANSSTHHTPSGDPPWMLNAFRPDPRLPPEKQILPTHARKLLQEQWEKEGKTGHIYDRDFSPLAIVDSNEMQRAVQLAAERREKEEEEAREQEYERRLAEQEKEEEERERERREKEAAERQNERPQETVKSPTLLSTDTPTEPTEPDKAASSPVAQVPAERRSTSKYRTMPPVHPLPPPVVETKVSRTPSPEQVQKEEEKKEKGCGCCIVM